MVKPKQTASNNWWSSKLFKTVVPSRAFRSHRDAYLVLPRKPLQWTTFIIAFICWALWSGVLHKPNVRNCNGQICDIRGGQIEVARRNAAYRNVPPLFQNEYDKIDSDYDEARCERYGYSYNAAQKPRRIFFGSMVADEHWDVFRAHATEAYNVYHVAALLESNTTHMNTRRVMRWEQGSEAWTILVQNKMFGSETKTVLDYWLEDYPTLFGMDRECTQRAALVDIWIKEGMTTEDIGIMADIDEIVSRDFLRAVQRCDIPQFRPRQDCATPKVVTLSISFESSPECIRRKAWYHPDIISGQCIDGIGDASDRVVATRMIDGLYGERTEEYGRLDMHQMREDIKKSGRYPLYNGADIRLVPGVADGRPAQWKGKRTTYRIGSNEIWGVAFHLHNFFDDFITLRNKYHSYGHGQSEGFNDMFTRPLSKIGPDMDMVVRCARKLPNSVSQYEGATFSIFEEGFDGTGGNKPIFFLNETYRRERHALLTRIVLEDENIHGSLYSANGTRI